ncbi:Na+/H+ antiporter subunit G [Paraliobacillus quinghaiensis]|uniref:Na+/H+ antiporter subunit G n=1 Tax=Paraliobacillus quinghaiensis TaxID=470815 RepID=A0A917TX40_9BACI|nr:monovalent cation/H(+) antiporter subunit G [Paraliobacillus quinghaiensis]GGM42322.1 Na+/H+ antiporter subunit G [Paraliobacillus quinghaiensis]
MIDFNLSVRQLFAFVFFIAGIYFLLSTAVGLIRFPNLYTRLHAGSKCLMAGGISVFMGCILLEGISFVSLKLIVIMVFLFITNPIAIHVIASFDNNYNLIPKTYTKEDLDK